MNNKLKHLLLFLLSIGILTALFFAVSEPVKSPYENLSRKDDTIFFPPPGKESNPVLEVGIVIGVILVTFGTVELVFLLICRVISRCRDPEPADLTH